MNDGCAGVVGSVVVKTEAADVEALRHHGDAETGPGLLDFAVNVQGTRPPEWLKRRLVSSLDGLGSYPSVAANLRARETVAARHGRSPEEVLLLSGGAEGFAMLPRLEPSLAALIHPSFTEPEWMLREAGVPIVRVILGHPYRLDVEIPDTADLVVVGNPTNPTSVLHSAEDIHRLRRPGRIVVVDEAFADAIPEEVESLAGESLRDVVVLRSLTKTWALAGLRCGYALGHPDVLARLRRGRAHWPLGSLQVEAITACCETFAVDLAREKADRIGVLRRSMIERFDSIGVSVHTPAAAPFLLLNVPDGNAVRDELRSRGIAVRRGDTFPGLSSDHLRVAVREPTETDMLVDALKEIL
ncbi:Rv2231c family pyridoxal phosphate-dependent protein CobC [Rhodococcus sp. NPDC058521]|uniref:Rv2231c family pyridoxal phosphate-dependent protein CobC n=1 Tax=Rhodococcus sp. NPDC058521 TaxID=3346536 RepID=UPI003657C56C